jgi:hypothetical protein
MLDPVASLHVPHQGYYCDQGCGLCRGPWRPELMMLIRGLLVKAYSESWSIGICLQCVKSGRLMDRGAKTYEIHD